MSHYENPKNLIGKIDEKKVSGQIDIEKGKSHESEGEKIEREVPQSYDECIQSKCCPCCFFRDGTITNVPDGAMSEGCCRMDQGERDHYRQGGESWQSIMARYKYGKEQLKEEYGEEIYNELMQEEDYHRPFSLREIEKQLNERKDMQHQEAA